LRQWLRVADIYTRYAAPHESMLEKPAVELALDALSSALPCPGDHQP
jgi:hypothetical protein